MAELALKRVWDTKLPPITRKIALEPMGLEFREIVLNERLLGIYYDRKHAAIKETARRLQRIGED